MASSWRFQRQINHVSQSPPSVLMEEPNMVFISFRVLMCIGTKWLCENDPCLSLFYSFLDCIFVFICCMQLEKQMLNCLTKGNWKSWKFCSIIHHQATPSCFPIILQCWMFSLLQCADVVKVLEDGDLQTLGMLDYDKRLAHSFTAHPKVDPFTGETYLPKCDLVKCYS